MRTNILVIAGILAVIFVQIYVGTSRPQPTPVIIEKVVSTSDTDSFSVDKLKSYLVELRVRFPHIVYAQAKLETGNFTSDVFRRNHNMFGMKTANIRATTGQKVEGTDYAYYNNWRESVLDYALYQNAFARYSTEAGYYYHLYRFYAEDRVYIAKLITIAPTFYD